MRSVDTNVLVRLITRDDPRQARAAESFVEHGAWIPTLVLQETIWLLDTVYHCSNGDIATAVEMLLNHRNLTLQESDVVASALARFRQRNAPEFSDCLILETARKAGHLPLGTFDRALGKSDEAERL
jgi:predicted nucleic-acid-binding protein